MLSGITLYLSIVILGWGLGIEKTCSCGGHKIPHVMKEGRCQDCKARTGSVMDLLCGECADAKEVCKHCGEKRRITWKWKRRAFL